jgi:hypothetical protein
LLLATQRFDYNSVVRKPKETGGKKDELIFSRRSGSAVDSYGPRTNKSLKPRRARALSTCCVLAAAADFHHVRFLSFTAIFATVLAAFLDRAITSAMRALAG